MPAAAARAANVTGAPARSSSRSAWIALARVSSCRRAAAVASGAVLLCTGGFLRVFFVFAAGFEGGDDLFEVDCYLLVHLGDAGVPGGFGGGDELQGGLPLGVVVREELGGGDEHRAGQAGVGVRAGLDQRELAVAVRERLGGAGQVLFCPGGVAERPVGADLDGLAGGVDLAGFLPVLPDGLV